MTSLAKEQLVTLVGNYYHGLVTFQSYRQQRNSILLPLNLLGNADDHSVFSGRS